MFMPVAKFLTPPKLFEYLDEEVKEALRRHGILRLFDYAWLNEYDEDRNTLVYSNGVITDFTLYSSRMPYPNLTPKKTSIRKTNLSLCQSYAET